LSQTVVLPVLVVEGTHREVGRQIGAACATTIQRAVAFDQGEIPGDGRTMVEQLTLARQYRDKTAEHLPFIVEELDAVAEAAGVDPLRYFAGAIEEIWTSQPSPSSRGGSALASERGRCSDLVVGPPATADGDVFVAHNNDLNARVEPHLVAIDWRVDDEPRMFTIGVGPWISVGWNESGMVLSGNEVAPNDNRVGIPRLLLVREQLRKTTMDDAIHAALHPARASAYNTVFAFPTGEARNVEGSATDAEVTGFDTDGTFVHTNHYVCPSMTSYEDDPPYAKRSAVRFERASALLADAVADDEPVTMPGLRAMLSDHENAPDSLCRHPTEETNSKTVFWCITNVTAGEIQFGRGNPCNSQPQSFAF
jgi:isopenicillin-N N-acyltransferase like protein